MSNPKAPSIAPWIAVDDPAAALTLFVEAPIIVPCAIGAPELWLQHEPEVVLPA